MKTTSPFGSLNFKDILLTGLWTALGSIGAAIIVLLNQVVESGNFDITLKQILAIITSGLALGAIVIIKQIFQNSKGQHFKKE